MGNVVEKYNEIIVIGPNSSLAKFVLGELKIDKSKLFGIYHNSKPNSLLDFFEEARLLPFQSIRQNSGNLQDALFTFGKSVLILNFSGSFGTVSTFESADPYEILQTVNWNLEGFIFGAKLLSSYRSESLMISFCGAGVGGDGLDDSSLGYLTAKSALVLLNEALDNQLMHLGLRLSLISPGAFPSEMQNAVASAPEGSVSDQRRGHAKNVFFHGPKHPEKIINMLTTLIDNPQIAGGRLWSAQHDNFQNSRGVKNFGKLRRIF